MHPNIKKGQKIILYKIAKNVLNFFLLAWTGALFVEVLIPGFISNYLSFTKIILVISVLTAIIYYLTEDFEVTAVQKENSKIMFTSAFLFALIVIVIASLNFSPITILVISVTTLLAIFYLYKIILEK